MANKTREKVAVLGGGSWGTALAVLLHSRGHLVKIWELYPERAGAMREARENADMLPGIKIPEDIVITSEMDEAVIRMDVVTLVVPSHGLRETIEKAAPFLKGNETLVIATKGIEEGTLKRMSEVARDVTGFSEDRIAVLVGPSHAEEVSRGVPTTVVSASTDEATAKRVQDIFITPTFRVYTNTDVVGVESGVSLKNVIAIAAGVCDGLGFGDNTKGALLTRGLAEMTRLGVKMGARQETFSGLAGLGDMVTTCISRHSRNRYVGEEIGKGRTLEEVLSGMVMVAEGVRTTKSAVGLAEKHQVEMPIAAQVFDILFKDKPVKEAIRELMLRSPKPEIWW
ncbi:NAD(P)H-dependent glycerol-3-phosphate dehydrogenase [Candidatus Eisenbacteria bacterium]|uniref:Glycerol-3-phosphate dehydrogenase [NAD(P)+] n=1 Tax=Eiseniibacteriota bacterium TaxID=2212470 RepID=A0ABV6YN90_UNCEI